MQSIYRLYHPECTAADGTLLQPCGISLQAWIAIFGAVQLIISQLPDISSLRELNLFCTLCTVLFAIGCLGMSIYDGGYSTVTLAIQAPSLTVCSHELDYRSCGLSTAALPSRAPTLVNPKVDITRVRPEWLQ